jgi:hypothetical protein
MSSAEIVKARGMRIRRDHSSSDEVGRAHVEAAKGANAGGAGVQGENGVGHRLASRAFDPKSAK